MAPPVRPELLAACHCADPEYPVRNDLIINVQVSFTRSDNPDFALSLVPLGSQIDQYLSDIFIPD